MDAVNAFNVELFSMIDMKPPISRAKMMSITKSAIKAIKLYKHVVQIVEKFIKKCKPELKIPGLYVVDSIVRQSRHQFGMDKDVFGPRFLKNFTATFQNLYMCPPDDKSKILRVLNLWQKNGVFGMDIIQPLLDMATGTVMPVVENGVPAAASPAPAVPAETPLPVTSASIVQALPQLQNSGALAAVAQLFQSSQGQELHQILQTLQQPQASVMEGSAGVVAAGPPMASAQPVPHSLPPTEQKSSFAKKLLDRFDYDDEPEPADDMKDDVAAAIPLNVQSNMQQQMMYPQCPAQIPGQPSGQMQVMGQSLLPQQMGAVPFMAQIEANAPPAPQQPQVAVVEAEPPARRDRKDDTRGRRSRSRSPRRHSPSRSRRSRSGSGSRSRRSRFHRSRSRSRDRRSRDWRSPRSRSEERRERERERERRQKGLPPLKSKTLSVCSTTLWVGQLDKKTTQPDISSLLEEFGQIESINMIPPRGCAYIVMVHRQDAYRALTSLSRGTVKVNQKPIKIAWALNKGIKPDLKKLWDVERGVTYIPWNKVKVEDLENYREGGMLDAETLCPDWDSSVKDLVKPGAGSSGSQEGQRKEEHSVSTVQVPPTQSVASAANPAFPPPMGLPPPAMMPGGPLPPFLPPGFDPTKIPPGFPPPGALPATGPPPTGPPPTGPPINMPPMSVVPGASAEEPKKDQMVPENAPSDAPGGQSMSPPPTGGLLGARPGMIPLQRPPGPPPPFMPHFPPDMPPPNMPPMPPPMMPRGPNPMMYREPPPGRFRMPMPHPPRDDFLPPPDDFPPGPMDDFPPPHGPPMGPEDVDDWEGPPPPPWHREPGWFRDQPPHRGRGGRGWGRDRPGPGGPPGRFMNRHEGFD
ncbi:SR-related and CTD-associated factor 4-like isoform X1 [Alosa sapidissima]|uniref:SR-related and CTD-associated factor 4-like isoform X1 n=1 Tax=Alosa sapidissima TaxID=34773 RepID=UPI001C0A3451|nr:SR-related and CTD-associated factor 4-like isoform X1 [Alosa sapidissima]